MAILVPNLSKQNFNYVTPTAIHSNVCAYLEVVGIINNINRPNGNNLYLKVYYNDNGRNGIVLLENSLLSDEKLMMKSLLSQNLFIDNRYAKLIASLLTQQARNVSITNAVTEFHYKNLGWHNINGTEYFLYDNNSTLILGRPSFCDREFQFTSGKKANYEQLLKNVVFPSKELTLAYVLGFSAVIVSRLNRLKLADLGTIVVNVSGKSSTGKSTMEQLMLSPFGNPSFSKYGLGITHSGTLNGILEAMEGIHGLPRVIDDLQQNSTINLTELLYTISQQETKLRCGEKWNQNTDGWSGLLVASSETPLMEMMKVQQGTYPRLLNLKDVQWTSSAQQAETIKSVVTQNYGFTGKTFVDYVSKIPTDKLTQAYQCQLMQVKNMMTEKDGLTDRIATRIAAIALTCGLVNHCFNRPFTWTMKDLITPLIESEQDTVQERNPAEKLLNLLLSYVKANKNLHFNVITLDRHSNPAITGKTAYEVSAKHENQGTITIYPDNKWKIVIYETVMKNLLKKADFNEWGSATKDLLARGLMIGTEEKKKNGSTVIRTRRKVGGIYCNVFNLEVPSDFLPEEQEPDSNASNSQPPLETPIDTTNWDDGVTAESIFGEGE